MNELIYRDTRKWCTNCYRKNHHICSIVRSLGRKQGGKAKDGSNRVPCECTVCHPTIIIHERERQST